MHNCSKILPEISNVILTVLKRNCMEKTVLFLPREFNNVVDTSESYV